jgi:hypothetical protein
MGRERERGNVRSTHLEEALLRLVVDERDDPRAGGLDELDVGGADVGGGGAVADPAARAVPRVRDDADDGGRSYAAGSGGAAHARAPAFPLGSRMTPADDGARRAGRRRMMSRRGERDESIGKTTGARGRPATDGGG